MDPQLGRQKPRGAGLANLRGRMAKNFRAGHRFHIERPTLLPSSGKTGLLIYRITNVPNCTTSFSELRTALLEEGIEEVYILGGWFDIHGDKKLPADPRKLGIDNYYEFPPHGFCTTVITGVVSEKDPDFVGNIGSYDSVM